MSDRNILLTQLNKIVENPKNSFDMIIKENSESLPLLPDNCLFDLYTLRRHCVGLCNLIPYSREEIGLLVASGEIDVHKKIAELENNFLIAEHIFEKYKDQ